MTKPKYRCPLCGSKIIISFHWAYTYDHTLLNNGTISKRCKKSASGPLEVATANCENVGCATWDADEFYFDNDGRFVDMKYKKEAANE